MLPVRTLANGRTGEALWQLLGEIYLYLPVALELLKMPKSMVSLIVRFGS